MAGATLQYTATVSPTDYDTDYYKVVFASSNASVATINASTGLATGVGAGTCNISAEFVLKADGSSLDPAVSDSMALEVTAE